MSRGVLAPALGALGVSMLAACFNPTYHNPMCGPHGECPDGLSCIAGTCHSPGGGGDDDAGPDDASEDAMVDVPVPIDARACFGSNEMELCFTGPVPSAPRNLTGALVTDTSPMCATDVAWTSPLQPDACVITGTGIAISGALTVTGTKPLVLLATDSISLPTASAIDAASHRVGSIGPGSNPAACSAFPAAPSDSVTGAGGGAGGSFMSKGGSGGPGGNGATAGIAPAANASGPAVLRGGCNGQNGANNAAGSGGTSGKGGGALYLVAGNSISIAGTIIVSGAGANGAAGAAGGGGGGGSGGMMVLHASTIISSNGRLGASGGGGGGAAGSGTGQPGLDPTFTPTAQPGTGGDGGAGNGCGGNGGTGGDGAYLTVAAQSGVAGNTGNVCGGGGGGGGIGYIRSNVAITGGVTASPAVSVVP
jgi:hypothetical protein